MKKEMTITYEVERSLYLNITNKCSNRCSFCIRNNGDGAYGSNSLWLTREPTVEEIWNAVVAANPSEYGEVVFCGYGEPSYRLDVMCEIATRIKEKYKTPVRVNTNGQSSLINGRDTAPDFSVFNCVSISLNAPTAERYQQICKSQYGERAFDAMLDFAREVKKYSPSVMLSVVKETMTEDELSACIRLCEEIGVKIKIRNYVG